MACFKPSGFFLNARAVVVAGLTFILAAAVSACGGSDGGAGESMPEAGTVAGAGTVGGAPQGGDPVGGGAGDPMGGAGGDAPVGGVTGGAPMGGAAGAPTPQVLELACETREELPLSSARGSPCSLTAGCPYGMFCDIAEGGRCNFECETDDECTPGEICGCNGLCLGGVDLDGVPTDNVCGRDLAVLTVAATRDAICQTDARCPVGAHCDRLLSRCRFDCVADADCSDGQTCDCDGRCTGDPTVVVDPAQAFPAVAELQPQEIQMAWPAGTTQAPPMPALDRFPVTVTVRPNPVLPGAFDGQPSMLVEGGADILVDCGSGVLRRFCEIKDWNEDKDNGQQSATVFLTGAPVRFPGAGGAASLQGPATGRWTVWFRSPDIQTPLGLSVSYGDKPSTDTGARWVPLANLNGLGPMSGSMTLVGPSGANYQVPVTAEVQDGRLVLIDPSGAFGHRGAIRLPVLKGQSLLNKWYEDATGTYNGGFRARVEMVQTTRWNSLSGDLSGAFTVAPIMAFNTAGQAAVQALWKGRFRLSPDDTLTPCVGVSGTVCPGADLGDETGRPTLRPGVAPNGSAFSGAVFSALDPSNISTLRMGAFLADCIDDIDVTATGDGSCVSQRRFRSISADRVAADDGKTLTLLWGRWARLMDFAAQQGIRELELAGVDAQMAQEPTTVSEKKLGLAIRMGWLWFLETISDAAAQPTLISVIDLLDTTPFPTLSGVLGKASGERTALPPSILTGLASFTRLVARAAEQELIFRAGGPLNPGEALLKSDALALIAVVEGLAHTLYERAVAGCDSFVFFCSNDLPYWQRDWEAAMADLDEARREVFGYMRKVVAGADPFGLEPGYVPMFFPDAITLAGATNRNYAATNFLLGRAEAERLTAAQNLEAARAAWTVATTTSLNNLRVTQETEDRTVAIRQQYAAPLNDACGTTGIGETLETDIDAGRLDPRSCYVNESCATSDLANFAEVVSPGAVRRRLCEMSQLRNRLQFPPAVEACLGASRDAGAAKAALDMLEASTFDISQGDTAAEATFACNGESIPVLTLLQEGALAAVSATDREDAEAFCADRFPGEDMPSLPLDSSCYRGVLGQTALDIQLAEARIGVALQGLEDAEFAYEESYRLCEFKITNEDQKRASRANVEKTRKAWKRRKRRARKFQKWAAGLRAARQMASSVASAASSVIKGDVGGAINSSLDVAQAGLDYQAGEAARDADAAGDSLRVAEAEYGTLVEELSANEAIKACFLESDLKRRAVNQLISEIDLERQALGALLVNLNDQQRGVERTIAEARSVLTREANKDSTIFSHRYWVDEKIDRYRNHLPWVKRLTYFALRAQEYESQQSNPDIRPGRVLSAQNPVALSALLNGLRADVDTRAVAGRVADDSTTLLSMRDLLPYIDSPEPVLFSATNAVGAFLASDAGNIYDDKGVFLGKGLTFDFMPGAPAAPTNVCAERMWQLSAAVQGDGLGPQAINGLPLSISRENRFGRQYCVGPSARPPGAGDIQWASPQPRVSLLASPGDTPVPNANRRSPTSYLRSTSNRRPCCNKRHPPPPAPTNLADSVCTVVTKSSFQRTTCPA